MTAWMLDLDPRHLFISLQLITGSAHNIDTVQIMVLQAHKPNESQKLTTQDNLVQVILFTCKQGFMCVKSFQYQAHATLPFATTG